MTKLSDISLISDLNCNSEIAALEKKSLSASFGSVYADFLLELTKEQMYFSPEIIKELADFSSISESFELKLSPAISDTPKPFDLPPSSQITIKTNDFSGVSTDDHLILDLYRPESSPVRPDLKAFLALLTKLFSLKKNKKKASGI